jgi:Tol biopolymer transport system component
MILGTEVEYPDYVSHPAWSPDGGWIAYLHGYQGVKIWRALFSSRPSTCGCCG